MIQKYKTIICFQSFSEKGPETLESVFHDFQGVCRKYTATGKGIMALQAAETGDMATAAALWEEAGHLGNTKSKFNLAVCYEKGSGVKKNLSKVSLLAIYFGITVYVGK